MTIKTNIQRTDRLNANKGSANNSTRAKYKVPYRLAGDRHGQKERGRDRLNRSRKMHKRKAENTKNRVYVRRERVWQGNNWRLNV